MVVRLALAPWTARLTLAIVVLFPVGGCGRGLPLEPEHAADAATLGGGHLDLAAQAALAGGGLLLEHVVQPGLSPEQLAVLRHPEAADGAPVGLCLGHVVSYGVRTGAGRAPGRWLGAGAAAGWPLPAAGGAPLPPWVLRGENTVIMLRPSCPAGLSTWAMSTRSAASRSSSRRPSSVWAISRPRNMIVT